MAKQVVKQYMSKHPILTLLLGLSVIGSVYGVVKALTIKKEDYQKIKGGQSNGEEKE